MKLGNLSIRWRLLVGFLLVASVTVLAGVFGIISLRRTQGHMSLTSQSVNRIVQQQTTQTNGAIQLRDLIDRIRSAKTVSELSQLEETQLAHFDETVAVNHASVQDIIAGIRRLVTSKRQEITSLSTLGEVDQAMSSKLEGMNREIAEIVDNVTFNVLVNIDDRTGPTNSATGQAEPTLAHTEESIEDVSTHVDRAITKIKSALTARTSILEVNLILKTALSTRDPNYPRESQHAIDKLYTDLRQQLEPLTDEKGIGSVETLVSELQTLTPKMIRAKTNQILSAQEFKRILKTVVDDVQKLNLSVVASAENLDKAVHEQFKGSSHFAQKSMITLMVISIIAFVLSVAIGMHMAHSFSTSINDVVGRVKDVSEGDLNQSIASTRQDEIGLLAQHFNMMVHNLKDMLGQIQSVAMQITSTGQEIQTISEAQVCGATEQSSAVSQTTSAAAELSKTSEQIGENIKTISQMANHVLIGMEKIKQATDQTNQILTSLNDKSKQIGNITELIDDVADQTNLLAVNASIEAARAGEQGRGFTVVADQISKLADSTAKSTKDITSLIEMIQHEMANAIIAMEQSLSGVEEEIQLAKDSASKSQEIAMSANQQIHGSKQIAEAMSSIDQTMKDIVFGATHSTESAGLLTGLADELKNSMARFKVSDYA